MRPVNLIPPEDRRGDSAPLRSGALPYVLLAGLVALLLGVTLLVVTNNQVAESKNEVARLEGENASAAAKAQQLAHFTAFHTMSEQRVDTVNSLADSRFDWERVMRELSLVLPNDVWLVALSASAAPGVGVQGGGSGESNMRGSIPGPALELTGCAHGQEAVAGFVTALKDIDGVTRVGVQSSELPEEGKSAEEGGGGGGGAGSTDNECRTRKFIAKFEIVVAFDAAPVPVESEEGELVASPVEKAETASTESSESATASTEAGGE